MATLDNLKEAFAGESQANRRYLAYARKAEEEGFPQVAKLFRAVAEAETMHAFAHLRVLGELKSTAQNLKEAIKGEAYEFKKMYPKFLAQAQKEKNNGAAFSFKNALAVEEIHHGLYDEALDAVKKGKDLPKGEIHVCPVCGNTIKGKIPKTCPICGYPKDSFIKVN